MKNFIKLILPAFSMVLLSSCEEGGSGGNSALSFRTNLGGGTTGGTTAGSTTAGSTTSGSTTAGSTTAGTTTGSPSLEGDDYLRSYQWHLDNTRQTTFSATQGTLGNDINLDATILSGTRGAGVFVGVSDTGVELDHEDLVANTSPADSKDYVNMFAPYYGDPYPEDPSEASEGHGTAVSGIIAAQGFNGIGVRGVAPEATIVGLKYLDSSQDTSRSLDQADGSAFSSGAEVSVFNYSYGGVSIYPHTPDDIYLDQLRDGVTNGRGGKGTIYVKAAGNEFISYIGYDDSGGLLPCYNVGSAGNGTCKYYGNANLSDEANAVPETLVVAAVNALGKKSSYSSPGSNIWISGMGGEFGNNSAGGAPAIMTTDLQGCYSGFASYYVSAVNSFERSPVFNVNCNYTSRMNGTSAATPIVVGAVALLLDQNPNLTWRDVRYILAATATTVDPDAADTGHPTGRNLAGYTYQYGWQQNAAGFWYHNYFGFGLVNVDNAIDMAKNYAVVLPALRRTEALNGAWLFSSGTVNLPIPDNSAVGATSTINVTDNMIIESVQIKLKTTNPALSNLGVEITSPSGTKSKVLNINNGAFNYQGLPYDALVMTNSFFGESSGGTWTLNVVDGEASNTGSLVYWQINVTGHDVTPTPPYSP
jgi:subtilisin family serine protease/subtilisin-like proprotein convertase family protein